MVLGPTTTTLLDFQKLPWLHGDKPSPVFKTHGVTVDATQITADGNGDKILKSGTILGKAAGGKYQAALPSVPQATFNDAVAEGAIVIYSKDPSMPLSVEFTDPSAASQNLSVSVGAGSLGFKLDISLGTDGGSLLDDTKNTATLIVAEINGDEQASKLFYAEVKAGDDGSGAVSAVIAETALLVTTALSDFVFLAEEINAKSGDAIAGGILVARVKEKLLPDSVSGVLNPGLKGLLHSAVVWM